MLNLLLTLYFWDQNQISVKLFDSPSRDIGDSDSVGFVSSIFTDRQIVLNNCVLPVLPLSERFFGNTQRSPMVYDSEALVGASASFLLKHFISSDIETYATSNFSRATPFCANNSVDFCVAKADLHARSITRCPGEPRMLHFEPSAPSFLLFLNFSLVNQPCADFNLLTLSMYLSSDSIRNLQRKYSAMALLDAGGNLLNLTPLASPHEIQV